MIEIINKLIVAIHNHVTYPYRLITSVFKCYKKNVNKNYNFTATGLFTYYTRMFDKIFLSVAVQLIFHISSFIIVGG